MLQVIWKKIEKVDFNSSDVWARAFGVLLFVYFVVIVTTLSDYGITSDEHGHVAYGEAIVNWYVSGFQDQTIFESKNTWLYGGLFDFGVALVSRVSYWDLVRWCTRWIFGRTFLGVDAALLWSCV